MRMSCDLGHPPEGFPGPVGCLGNERVEVQEGDENGDEGRLMMDGGNVPIRLVFSMSRVGFEVCVFTSRQL